MIDIDETNSLTEVSSESCDESGFLDDSMEFVNNSNESPIKKYVESQKIHYSHTGDDSSSLQYLERITSRAKYHEDNDKKLHNIPLTKRRKIEPETDASVPIQRDTWVSESTPTNVDELCIHGKKIKDLQTILEDLIYRRTDNKFVVVCGPTGCGKSTSVKVLCEKIMKEKMKYWNDSIVGSEINDQLILSNQEFNKHDKDDEQSNNEYYIEFNILKSSNYGNSSTTYFGEFLEQCKLLTGINEKCVIIEELPNLFHKETHQNFMDSLLKWINSSDSIQLPPLVLCITEFDIDNDLDFNNSLTFTIDNIFKVETVLGNILLGMENRGWKRIKFNRVARTFLKKALTRVSNLEKCVKNKQLHNKIEELSVLGDLRNAINTFEFWYKFQRRDDKSDAKYQISGKESGIDLFHSIGKVLFGTRHEEEEFEDFQKRHNFKISRDRIPSNIITVDNVSSEISSHLTKFNLCCLENYSILNPNVDSGLAEFNDVMSSVDVMMTGVRTFNQPSIISNLSFWNCLSLRVISEKIKNNAGHIPERRIKYTRDSKFNKKLVNINKEIKDFQMRRRKRLLQSMKFINLNKLEAILIDGFYQSIIFASFKFRYQRYKLGLKNSTNIERLGGNFRDSIFPDDDFVVEEEPDDDVPSNGKVHTDVNELENGYFGVVVGDSDGPEGSLSGEEYGEIESDPIEDSDDEAAKGDNDSNVDHEQDFFSDDSETMKFIDSL